ncbi:amino-acid N-acetyltransferase [Fibrobacter sp. HC4]|uniref:amino-acid N-acetyltransferase n=1 Tax=Fibrobacter sp. HC4 TaxID=3239812 RepID=UPI002018CB0F|nr:amino-acid N-acetyltransferase [Fibrobacter succinogenes]MCL4102273.1 Amino-acid acetyltransferase [Fibrobacter succinogenes]MCQ2098863.1 amino-acid N-acetyltransferase [Fibrobacter sp.]
MNPNDFTSQHFEIAGFIREVFGYMERFKGQLFVLKIEDDLMSHPLFPVLMRDIGLLHKSGIKIIIVPGTRNSIDAQLKAWGVESKFHNGVRLTCEDALPHVEQASLGAAQHIMSHLTASGLRGIQGNWILARSMGVVNGVDYMRTGRIERIQKDILEQLLDENFVPIIPPIGWNKIGHAYNISSTELATELCKYMKVGKLFFIGNQDGIKLDGLVTGKNTKYLEPTDNGLISAMDVDQAQELLELNSDTLNFAQMDYLMNAIHACKAGANRVHLLSGEFQGSLLQEVFSARGDGTMVYANQYSSIRPANMEDIPDILRIMQDYIDQGFLVPRTQESISEKLKDYVVYNIDNSIHGCGALHEFEDGMAEIAGIAVGANYRKSGIGDAIVRHLISVGRMKGCKKLFLLTTQALDWFYHFGFVDGTVEELPKTKRDHYNQKRKSRILMLPLEK